VRRARAARGLAVAVVAAALLRPGGPARAAGDDEWQLSARIGAATVNVDERKPWGYAGALDLEYGLSDAWAARLSVEASGHPVSARASDGAPGGTVETTAALAGLTYTFDVLRLVPYAELGVGVVRFGGAVIAPHTTLAMELGVGADYLLTPRWACGVSFQYLFAPTDLASNALSLGQTPFAFSATLRASRSF
jgi:opacity protein-like surface antigen